ncbi:MAG: HAD hydrolase family protein [Candidatus Omnitrophica bacterium]|nr:HAD hydrolase family protein [Candidatus Omnitrophota bacterium]
MGREQTLAHHSRPTTHDRVNMELDLKERINKVKLVIVDIDGVMTDGRIVLGDHGDELKFFDAQDGHGMVMLRRAGIRTVLLSGRKSRVNVRRAKEIQVVKLYQNAHDKLKVFEKILKKFKVGPEEVCYMADDLIDLPVLTRVGFSVTVPDAVPEVKERAHCVTERKGGRGAVRELTDLLLKTQDKWQAVTERYFR